MAIMNPATPPPPGPGQVAEGALWHALKQGLGDDFFVYYRCGYDAARPRGDGDVDFLVVHRELGMLAIECKGSGVELVNGVWMHEVNGTRGEMPKSPFEQARNNAHVLAEEIGRRAQAVLPHLRELPLPYTHAVAFPRAEWTRGDLPLEARSETLWDSRDLPRIGEKVLAALEVARAKSSRVEPLDPPSFKKLRQHVLERRYRLTSTIGARILAAEPQQVELSEGQREAARGWIGNARFRIAGGAGTGKTLAAIEAVRLMGEAGLDAILLCYNKALADHLERCVAGREIGPGKVGATSFHRLCRAAYLALGRKMDVPDEEPARTRFWNDEAPYVLLEAIAEGRIEKRDAVVVDEGQDFAATWWEVIEALLRDPAKSRVLVFYDPAQDIFGRGAPVPEWTGIELNRNFRNARRINDVVCRLGNVRMKSVWYAAEGEEPRVEAQRSKPETLARLNGIIGDLLEQERLSPDQIVVLTPHSRKHSTLDGVERIAGIPLAFDPSGREACILHSTIGAYKGLESDVVILIDIDTAEPLSNLKARYVAASRARHALYVMCTGEFMPAE